MFGQNIVMAAALALALISSHCRYFIWFAGAIYFITTLATSTFLCNNSTELLALARPGNKTMALAFQQTYQNFGITVSRIGTALVMGSNLLAPTWQLGALTLCSYQTLFLFYGIIAAVLLILLPSLPAVVPRHNDYYEP